MIVNEMQLIERIRSVVQIVVTREKSYLTPSLIPLPTGFVVSSLTSRYLKGVGPRISTSYVIHGFRFTKQHPTNFRTGGDLYEDIQDVVGVFVPLNLTFGPPTTEIVRRHPWIC